MLAGDLYTKIAVDTLHTFHHGVAGAHLLPAVFQLIKYGRAGTEGKKRAKAADIMKDIDDACGTPASPTLPRGLQRARSIASTDRLPGLTALGASSSSLSFADGDHIAALLHVRPLVSCHTPTE
jgi:alcohol dehydrogenase class IV